MRIICRDDKLIIIGRQKVRFISLHEIYYIERFDNQTFIHTSTEQIPVRISLKQILELLPSSFVRTHKSFIVNFNAIKELTSLNDRLYEVQFNENKYALISKEVLELS